MIEEGVIDEPATSGRPPAQPCPGCGLITEPAEGPTHPYMGASPGCWAAFGALMLQPFGAAASGQLLGDAYAVQHPGVPERRAVQSVCVHLILLCATLERGWPPERAVQLRRRAIDKLADRWRWLDPQLPLGTLTIASLSEAADADDRGQRLQAWAEDVWAAYQPHHAGVRRWVDTLLT